MIMIFGTRFKNDDVSRAVFSFFLNFDFMGCYGGKSAKNGPK